MPIPFETIDWYRPWLQEFRLLAAPILSASDLHVALNDQANRQGLCNQQRLPIRFVPQDDLPAGVAYEEYIWSSGHVPTRDNLHDFFNALVWLAYPRIKARLNAMQAAEIGAARLRGDTLRQRGALRDALTIFDENAAVVALRRCPEALALKEAIVAHRWHEVFLERRAVFGVQCDVRLFGHALMEKLITPYKAITAHARFLEVDDEYFRCSVNDQRAIIDETAAAALEHASVAGLTKAPLPLAGVPGWFTDQDAAFYSDTAVFRIKQATAAKIV